MKAHQSFEGRFFIACVMINVGIRMFFQMFCYKIHKIFKGFFFSVAIMAPEGFKFMRIAFFIIKSKQIFQAAWFQRVPFHVEKKVPVIRLRQSEKTPNPFRVRRKKFIYIFFCFPFFILEHGLVAYFFKRIRVYF